MGDKGPRVFRVTWTAQGMDVLVELLLSTKHGQAYPHWVDQKFEECILEGVRRLELFPDLRVRYATS